MQFTMTNFVIGFFDRSNGRFFLLWNLTESALLDQRQPENVFFSSLNYNVRQRFKEMGDTVIRFR
mgnify:CR=1 FL=1